MRNFLLYLLGIAGAIILLALFFSRDTALPGTQEQDQNTTEVMTGKYSQPPPMTIDKSKTYTAEAVTDYGNFTVDLFTAEVPVTVNNFVFLARENFYDNVVFHRVIKDFMIQTGDPNGDGTGGPGYKFEDEPVTRDYKRGTVAMANSGPDTNGSQFFIMHADNDLPKNYVIFGEVSKGMETIDKIADVEVGDNGMGEPSKPKEEITIKSVTVSEK